MKDFLRREFEESLRLTNADGGKTTVNEKDQTFLTDSVSVGKLSFTAPEVLSFDPDGYQSAYDDWVEDTFIADRIDQIERCLDDKPNSERLESLKEIVEKGNVVPYVGAGFSMPTKFPRWTTFLKDVATEIGFDPSRLDSLLESGQYELAAEEIEAAATGAEFNERCEEKFKLRSSHRIRGAVCLMPYVFEEMVITTNFDPILEAVYDGSDRSFARVEYGAKCDNLRELYSERAHVLHKLHGDYSKPTTRILTKSEFDKFYGDPTLRFRADFEDLVTHRSLLFLGCSLTVDRPLSIIREAFIRDPNMPRHYAFIESPATEAERIARKSELLQANIFPIWYGTKEEVEADELDRDLYNQALLVFLARKKGTTPNYEI